MQWTDIATSPSVPVDVFLPLQRESVRRRPDDVKRRAQLGRVLMELGIYSEAAAEFETANQLGAIDSGNFQSLARCHLLLGRPDTALEVCEHWKEVMPNCSDLYEMRGLALRKLGRVAEAQDAFLKAVSLSDSAFAAVESLLAPLASDPDGTKMLTLCDQLPPSYANSTVVRGYRAIGLSRAGRIDEAMALVNLDRWVLQVPFEPPHKFGSIEDFNALLADEIFSNPSLRYKPDYGFHRAEPLNITGARAFPILAQFLRAAIERYLAELPDRGLDAILAPAPKEGSLYSGGNVVRGPEGHHAHLHKFAYVSGVYHVVVPRELAQAEGRAGALVLGSSEGLTAGYVPCWKARDIKPLAGVATIFPAHIFHSVVPTRSESPRIAVPFDLCGAMLRTILG